MPTATANPPKGNGEPLRTARRNIALKSGEKARHLIIAPSEVLA